VITALEDPALNAVSLGKEQMFTAAEAIVWGAAAGLEVCNPSCGCGPALDQPQQHTTPHPQGFRCIQIKSHIR
jgi:hypothetical protein